MPRPELSCDECQYTTDVAHPCDRHKPEATGEPAQRKEAMKAKEFIQKFDAEKDGLWNLPELLEAYCAQVTSQRDAHKQALVEECVRSRSKDEQIRNLEQKVAQRDARIAELEKERGAKWA